MADVERPIFLGTAAPDECDGCRKESEEARATAKWLLPCEHFVCRSCVNKLWITKMPSQETVCCPVFDCMRSANFLPQPPIQSVRVDRDLMEHADLKEYGQKVLNYPISVETNEAIYFMTELYEGVQDQSLDADALGTFPASGLLEEPLASFYSFFQDPLRPALITPLELHGQLRQVLDQATIVGAQPSYEQALLQNANYGAALHGGNPSAVFKLAKDTIDDVQEKWAVWVELVGKLVGLLTIRHLERFRTPDDEDQKEE